MSNLSAIVSVFRTVAMFVTVDW